LSILTQQLSPKFIDKPLSLREQVGSLIRAALTTGEMQQGQTYSVPLLAEKFGVSATPVREAILDLTKEGLFYALPNKGFRVVEISEFVFKQITDVRLLLEIPFHIQVAKIISQDGIDELREIATRVQKYAEKKDLLNFIEHDRMFHNGIIKIFGNEFMLEISDQLRSRARLHVLPHVLITGQLETSATEHFTILEAMETKNFQALEQVLEHHMSYGMKASSK
jgi:DNA-binding GntR family transcriptional regulator